MNEKALKTEVSDLYRFVYRSLNKQDRCDSCPARALVVFGKPNHGVLMFCGHHANRNLGAAIASGWRVDDQYCLQLEEDSKKILKQ